MSTPSSSSEPRAALTAIVEWLAEHPFVGIALVILGLVDGAVAFGDLPRDVFPDLTTPTFNVIVQSPAMGSEEIERRVAIPIERAMAGLPGLRRVRSTCQAGVVQTTVELDPDFDYFRGRQLVGERVAMAQSALPPGLEAPVVSGVSGRLNEVAELVIEPTSEGSADPMTLRDFVEYELRNRLLAVPGVGGLDIVGGLLRQVQVRADPDRMRARDVSLEEVMRASEGASSSASAGVVPAGEIEWAVELDGRADSAFDLGRTVVADRHGAPVLLSDVAEVVDGGAFRRGVARHHGAEVVHVRIVRQVGADAVHVSAAVRSALAELEPPPGISVDVTYDQAELVDGALGGVGRAVAIGAVFVVLVILLLLGDFRAALVVALSIPTSVALAIAALGRAGGGLDTMTLGGLAISVGILVDASIIVVENAAHRLKDAHGSIPKHWVVTHAAGEMARPIVFATFVVIAVFVPLFGMAGIEGRMYRALALSVIAAMGASLFVALGVTPAVAGRVLSAKHGEEGKGLIVRVIERAYAPILGFALRRPRVIQLAALCITVPVIVLGASVGADFVPHLDEGYLMLETGVAPEASLETADRLVSAVEEAAAGFDQVRNVTRRLGRGERTEDPMPHTNADVLVELIPDRTMDDEAIAEALRERVSHAPGTQVLFTTPLQMRIDEGLGGSPADLQVRIFGTDLDILAGVANRLRDEMRHVRGLADVRTDVAGQSPELRVRLDRVALVRAHLTPGDVTEAVRTATVGREAGVVFRGGRRLDVMVRLGQPGSIDPEELRMLPLETPDGTRLPLSRVAEITSTVGPSIVRREAGQRRVGIEASVVGRDLGSAADEVRRLVARAVRSYFPEGTFASVGGRIETQDAANRALALAIALAVALVLILVYIALGSLAETALILGTLPSALVGGIVALLIAGETWNVSSLVGLLGLFGIAVQNGLVLVSQTRGLEAHGIAYDEAVREASLGRVRPKLMTASTAMLGLLPLVVLPLRGVELERPLAIVMIGGLVTSTLFTLVVLPTFLTDLGRFRAQRKPKKEEAST